MTVVGGKIIITVYGKVKGTEFVIYKKDYDYTGGPPKEGSPSELLAYYDNKYPDKDWSFKVTKK